jgi:hypothetical protein
MIAEGRDHKVMNDGGCLSLECPAGHAGTTSTLSQQIGQMVFLAIETNDLAESVQLPLRMDQLLSVRAQLDHPGLLFPQTLQPFTILTQFPQERRSSRCLWFLQCASQPFDSMVCADDISMESFDWVVIW